MARARNIKPGFFQNDEQQTPDLSFSWRLKARRLDADEFFYDDILAECRVESRLLFLGLWALANDMGWLPDDPIQIHRHLPILGDVRVDDLLNDLVSHGQIERSAGIQVVGWTHWQGHIRRYISSWGRLRLQVFERDGYVCRYCGVYTGHPHCDHVLPKSRGGSDEPDNLVTACRSCNLSKHARTPEEWLGAAQ